MKKNELLKNTGIIAIGRISTQIISFLLLPLYTARLRPEEYGNFDYVVTIASFLNPVMTLLMEEAMFRFLMDCKTNLEKERVISQTFFFMLVNGGVISCFGIFITSITEYELGAYILVYTIANLMLCLSNALARGLGNIALYAIANVVCSVGNIILNLLLIVVFDLGFSAMIFSAIISNALATVCVLARLKVWRYIKPQKINGTLMKEMLKYSLPLVPNSLSWIVINLSDRMVIMHFLGSYYNGLYSVSNKFPNLINTYYGFFNTAWRETSIKVIREGNLDELNMIHQIIRNLLFSVTILLIGFLHLIYPLFVDNAYSESIWYVPILAVAVYFLSLSGFYGGIFTALKNTKVLGSTSIIAACINLGANLALVRVCGVYASAVSTLLSSVFLYLHRKSNVKEYINRNILQEVAYILGFILFIFGFYRAEYAAKFVLTGLTLVVSILINKKIIVTAIRTICESR